MDTTILKDYIDACALIKETEQDIRRLRQKKKTTVQTTVKGSSADFPYIGQRIQIRGTAFTYEDDIILRREEELLQERKANAEKIKIQVEGWMNRLPMRMQRIIRLKIFQKLSWDEVAAQMGRGATADSIRMEYKNFIYRNKK